MAYRLNPGQTISESVHLVGIDQIDRVLAQFSNKNKVAAAVHDARKAMKRLRALLHLIKSGMDKAEFRRDEARLKMIGRSLSGTRDAQAMLETVGKLDALEGAENLASVSSALRAMLEERRAAAESELKRSGTGPLRKQLKEARDAFAQISLQPDDFTVVAETLEKDYRKARQEFSRAYQSGEDEAFHDWRKHVQRHWRQLLLIAPSWPKAIRPHIALARELSEILGDDHDLSVLADLTMAEADRLGQPDEIAAYVSFCRKRQSELRRLAHERGARLLAEKPRSLARRVTIYWETAEPADGEEVSEDPNQNVIALKR